MAKAKAEREAKRSGSKPTVAEETISYASTHKEEVEQVVAITSCDPALAAFVLEAKSGGDVGGAVSAILDGDDATLSAEMVAWNEGAKERQAAAAGEDDISAGHNEPDESFRLERCACTTLVKLCVQAIAFRSTKNMTQAPHPADQAGFIGLAPLIVAAEADLAKATKAHLDQCAVGLSAASKAEEEAAQAAEVSDGSGPAGGIKIGGEPLKILQSDWTSDLESVFAIGEKRKVVKAAPFTAAREKGGLDNSSEVNGNVVIIMRGDISFSEKYDIAVNAGAVAVLIANNNGDKPDEVFHMGQKEYDDRNTGEKSVPLAMISLNTWLKVSDLFDVADKINADKAKAEAEAEVKDGDEADAGVVIAEFVEGNGDEDVTTAQGHTFSSTPPSCLNWPSMPVLGLEVLFEEGASGGADPRLTLFDRLIAKAAKKSIFTKYWAEGLNPRMMRNPPLPSTVLVLPPGFKLHCRPTVTDAGCRSRYWGRLISQTDPLALTAGEDEPDGVASPGSPTKPRASPSPSPSPAKVETTEGAGGAGGGWGFSLPSVGLSAAVNAVAAATGAVDAPLGALNACDALKITEGDLTAFAGVPLRSLRRFLEFTVAAEADGDDGDGDELPSDVLPFDVSGHPNAKSSAARAMIERMGEDVRKVSHPGRCPPLCAVARCYTCGFELNSSMCNLGSTS